MAALQCANWKQENGNLVCPNLGTKICPRCYLVAYCSKECQTAHWPIHKLDCNDKLRKTTWKTAWEAENRTPTFIGGDGGGPQPDLVQFGGKKYLWGNVPALNVLQLKDNEGVDNSRDLSLLFAASGDLRNFVKTISSIPDSYSGHIHVDVNDRDETVVARSLIILLVAFNFPPEKASEMMLHIWYSAFLTEKASKSLQHRIFPIIRNFLLSKPAESANVLQCTWSYKNAKLSAALSRRAWNALESYFPGKSGISFDRAAAFRQSVTLASSRTDYRDRFLSRLPPSWRLAQVKFRKDGVLLPFSASLEKFTIPNPTLFQDQSVWPMPDSEDPLNGWDLSEVLRQSYGAKDDLYGLLHIYIRKMLLRFCEKLATLKLSICLFQTDAVDLPDQIAALRKGTKPTYDRIELANIADGGYLGPIKTLGIFGALLKNPDENPKATLLTLFLNATHEVTTPDDQRANLTKSMNKVTQFIPINRAAVFSGNINDSSMINVMKAQSLFTDYDVLFNRFMEYTQLKDVGDFLGLGMKGRNTIVAK